MDSLPSSGDSYQCRRQTCVLFSWSFQSRQSPRHPWRNWLKEHRYAAVACAVKASFTEPWESTMSNGSSLLPCPRHSVCKQALCSFWISLQRCHSHTCQLSSLPCLPGSETWCLTKVPIQPSRWTQSHSGSQRFLLP